jgi:DNA-binding phage protein
MIRKGIYKKEVIKMTNEHREILQRINSYSENVLGEIDPQKVQVSMQLEKLKPIMEEIAKEKNMSLEDMFILYMDLQTEASCESQRKLKDTLQDLNHGDGMPMLFR